MELNKYYTPNPDEMYIGFEYEIQDELVWDWNNEFRNKKDFLGNLITGSYKKFNFGWFPKIYDGSELLKYEIQYVCIDNTLEPKLRSYRVKYLDKEDIESLGWKGNDSNSVYFTKDNYRLVHWITNEGRDISIFEKYDGGTQEECLVRKCIIKNKSELVKLMKQLEIK